MRFTAASRSIVVRCGKRAIRLKEWRVAINRVLRAFFVIYFRFFFLDLFQIFSAKILKWISQNYRL